MSRLVDFYERRLRTDFAILRVHQAECFDVADTMTYAASAPGMVALLAGHKYAELAVRLERWDGEPPHLEGDWDEHDELPWLEVPQAGPLRVGGFDPAPDEGLDVTGLGRARVQVATWGRSRYSYSEGPQDLDPDYDYDLADDEQDWTPWPPERWLLQFWPDPDERDAMSGPPRRLAGPPEFAKTDVPLELDDGNWLKDDLVHLARWSSPGPLLTTPAQLAARLSLPAELVLRRIRRGFGDSGQLAFESPTGQRLSPADRYRLRLDDEIRLPIA